MHILVEEYHQLVTQTGETLNKLLSQLGVNILTTGEQSKKLKSINGIIIDGKEINIEKGYLAAYAISEKTPVICLLPKGFPIPEMFAHLVEKPEFKKYFRILFYQPQTLEKVVRECLVFFHGPQKEKPSIKFTLRITPSMEQFLETQSKAKQVTKADYLRNQIEQLMSQ